MSSISTPSPMTTTIPVPCSSELHSRNQPPLMEIHQSMLMDNERNKGNIRTNEIEVHHSEYADDHEQAAQNGDLLMHDIVGQSKQLELARQRQELNEDYQEEHGEGEQDEYSQPSFVVSGDESDSSGSEDESASFLNDDDLKVEGLLTDNEIEDLLGEFLETESKAAEAQEILEDESLARMEMEVRQELAEQLQGHDLDVAVADEMKTFVEEWKEALDNLETESALLLEQLDGAGVSLPDLFKWIEGQTPEGCNTEAWRKRTHWVGCHLTGEVSEAVTSADKYLQACRPSRRHRGKLLEEGAGGYLARKFRIQHNDEGEEIDTAKEWDSVKEQLQLQDSSMESKSFGSEGWAAVYMASTPHQAASMGLKLPGVNEVVEIDDMESCSKDPFFADAVANEREIELTDEQKRNFRKVKEEEDVKDDKRLQVRLHRRKKCRKNQEIGVSDTLQTRAIRNDKDKVDPFESHTQPSTEVDKNGPILVPLQGRTNQLAIESIDSTTMIENDVSKHAHDDIRCRPDPIESPTILIGYDVRGSEKESRERAYANVQDNIANSKLIHGELVEIADDEKDGLHHIVRNEADFLVGNDSQTFECTICFRALKAVEVCRHPLLGVIVCASCKDFLEEKTSQRDLDCCICYCGWCGRSKDLIRCQSCDMMFCSACIKRNLGEDQLNSCGWTCCCCSRGLLNHLILEYGKASATGEQLLSSSESGGSVLSSNDLGITSSKKRLKKRIRRIIDDAELGEETKKMIAIEKERQDRIKSLHIAGNTWTNSASCNGGIGDLGCDGIMGNAIDDYIVNVVREETEEPVRLPPSISAFLRPHQIAGIRFMWENCIQSVRKVKSGDKGLGCILAHTMGLGKTLQVITFLYATMRSADLGLKTALIVTPVNVLYNWRQEFIKWKPTELKPLRVLMLEDVSRENVHRARLLAKWREKGGVLLIGYATFRNLSLGKHVKDKVLAAELCHSLQNGPDVLVCDEAHIIKNTRADITQALRQVKCQRRIALTGSPLQNNLMEYYCMVDFVREGFLGSSVEFRNRFQNPIENGQHTNSTADDVKIMNQRSHILNEQLKGFVHRMGVAVIKNELPEKTVYVISVKLSPLQRKLYKRFLDVHGFAHGMIPNERTTKRSCFFSGYHTLAQIWNHPGILQIVKEQKDNHRVEYIDEDFLADGDSSDEMHHDGLPEKWRIKPGDLSKMNVSGLFDEGSDWWADLLQKKISSEVEYSGKMVLLLEILNMSSEVGDKVLVFSQSLSTLDLIELFLSKLPRKGSQSKCWKQGKDWCRLDGSTGSLERQKLVDNFNNPENERVKCALISTRAGSLGINLYAANRVIVVDGSWNPTHDLQAIYRVWRYGQQKPVYAYRLMSHGTMEDKIYKRQVTKEGLAARVVDRQQISRTMSKEEVLHLFEFGEDEIMDMFPEQGKGDLPDQDVACLGELDHTSPFPVASSSDKIMEALLNKHHPRWIASYHEHESLLQENEEERLSKEEEELAWQTFLRSLEWEEVRRQAVGDYEANQNPSSSQNRENTSHPVMNVSRSRPGLLRCTNLAHQLMLKSRDVKVGSSIVCTVCAMEVSWKNLNGNP